MRIVVPDHAELLGEYLQGAVAWEASGFEVGVDDLGPECDRHWYVAPRMVDCQITIGIVREANLRERRGTDALSDRELRTVWIDARVTSFELLIATAHEVGHIALDTKVHTVGGVMGGNDWVLHDVDRALAHDTVGAEL